MDAVDTLIDIEGVGAIIGGHASNVRDAVSARIAQRVPYIYTPQYEGGAMGPSTVAIGSVDGELLAPALAWFKSERQAERFFFIGNDYIWPRMAATTTRNILRREGRHRPIQFEVAGHSGAMRIQRVDVFLIGID